MNHNQLNQYQRNQILTASPEQILIMLYDGAIRFTKQAIMGVEKGDAQLRRYGISKAMAIITEFSNSLDHDIGGQIAEDLDALYHFMVRELTSVNLKEDIQKLKVVEKLLTNLRLTWTEAIEVNKKEKTNITPDIPGLSSNRPPEKYTSFSISR